MACIGIEGTVAVVPSLAVCSCVCVEKEAGLLVLAEKMEITDVLSLIC